jgi:hypothetical protein
MVVGQFDCGSRFFRLAFKPGAPHIQTVLETYPFTFDIQADPLRESRYRWTVCQGVQIHVRSPHSYSTRLEAEKKADGYVKARGTLAEWRMINLTRRPSDLNQWAKRMVDARAHDVHVL